MSFDAKKNFVYSTVATAPDPADSGTTLIVAAGQGARFPNPATDGEFNIVVWPTGVQPLSSNAEIVRVTERSTDTLTIVREQEDTSARSIIVTDQVGLNVTKKTIADLENALSNSFYVDQSGGTSDTYGALSGTINGSNKTFTVSESAYISGNLKVYLNGQLQTQGSGEDWVENTPASGTFDFNTAPVAGDEITVVYLKTSGGTHNADTVDGIHAASTPTANKLIALDADKNLPMDDAGDILWNSGAKIERDDGHLVLTPETSKLVKIQVLRQNNTSDAYKENTVFLTGWGFMPGDGTNRVETETVTFGITFSAVPIVLMSSLGYLNESDPDSIDDFDAGGGIISATYLATCRNIAVGSFFAILLQADNNPIAATYRIGYSWFAPGKLD